MGAEGARITYPYLSGQWTELKQCDDTFLIRVIYKYICKDDYTILFFQPEYIFICSGFSIYLPKRERKMYKKKEVMKNVGNVERN